MLALLLLLGCGVAAAGEAGQTPEPFAPTGDQSAIPNTMPEKNLVANPDLDIPLPETTLPKGPQESAPDEPPGPHNKVEGGFQVGEVFIPDEVAGFPIVDVLSSDDTPCLDGVSVTVRGTAGDDIPVRRFLHDRFGNDFIVTNVTDRVSDETVYAGNDRRIVRDAEQGCWAYQPPPGLNMKGWDATPTP